MQDRVALIGKLGQLRVQSKVFKHVYDATANTADLPPNSYLSAGRAYFFEKLFLD